MYARLLAAFCLISFGFAQGPPDQEVVVYLHADPSQPPHPLDFMKLETGRMLAVAGYRVAWRDAHSGETVASQVVAVDLHGICNHLTDASAPVPARFASTAVSEGRVLPFVSIDCSGLAHVLARPLLSEAVQRQDFLLGRAMARVLAHELYHVILRTTDHAHEGVARSGFTVTDLLTEHFEFELTTLARMQAAPARVVSSTASADAIDR